MNRKNYVLLGIVVVACLTILYTESKEMNNNQKHTAGCFFAHDDSGRAIVITWHKTNIVAGELACFKREVSDLASQVTAASEAQFLKNFPDAVSSGGFLKSCEPLFADGVEFVDWVAVEQKLQESIKQFYLMDLSVFGQAMIDKLMDDVYFFAMVRDQATSQLLAFIMSSITPALPKGDIKLINLVIAPCEQEKGLEALLLGSLACVMPEVKRIFTAVRPTNNLVLEGLGACGFVEDKNPIQDPYHPIDSKHFVVLECKADQSELLQKTAERLSA
jgi:hypothetical protein